MTPKELAAAIRKGAGMVDETRFCSSGCVLGTAYLGVTGKDLLGDSRPYIDLKTTNRLAADVLGITFEFAKALQIKHLQGLPRLAIADWLDTLEPETKPEDNQTFESFMPTVLRPVEVTA